MGTVVITKRPEVTVYNGSPSVSISRWNASAVPVNYEFLFELPTDRIIVKYYEKGSNTLLDVKTYAPNPALKLNINVAGVARGYLYSDLQDDFEGVNKKDIGSTIKIYFTYQVYDINEDPSALSPRTLFSEESNYIAVTQSAKQYGDLYGGNMGEYVPFGNEQPNKAKFLTAFETPILFEGFPFTLSFIYADGIASHDIICQQNQLDINGTNLASVESELDQSQAGVINYLKLSSYTVDTKFIDVKLVIGEATEQLYVDYGYVETGYTEILI